MGGLFRHNRIDFLSPYSIGGFFPIVFIEGVGLTIFKKPVNILFA